MWGYLYYLLIFLKLVSEAGTVVNEIRCGSVDIRNSPKMAFQPRTFGHNESLRYRDCTIIDGDITISMITNTNHSHDDYPVFENLREITGSILVFHAKSLRSLGKMFPNLRVIGGNSLIMNYALVVYQNEDLRQVNLTKLTTIKNGGVRITENAKLCYTKNINWEKIMVGNIRDFIVDQVAGRCESVCAVEDESVCERDNGGKPICWNPTTCQKTCKRQVGQADHSGCTELGEPCHPLCVGGCFEPNNPGACYTCRFFDVEGVCVEKCPPGMYAMLKRRCLTRKQCLDLFPVIGQPINEMEVRKPWKAFQNVCHYDCPSDYQPDPDDLRKCVKCPGYCPKICIGDMVDSIGSALKFAKCNVINGNLEVDMRVGMESTSGEKFTEAFGEIQEIRGYLLIRFSTAFMSLHMFKSLKVIHGATLWKNMYALVVFENPNLRQLFQQDGIEIARGKISFQNNRMLCYKTITAFMHNAVMHENISESDVSSFSNGDKAICDEIPLEIKIVSVYSYGFTLSWTPFNTTDMDHRKFLGYQIFYKQVEKEDYNMSIDDDRSACSDSWNMVFVTEGTSINEFNGESAGGEESRENHTRGELINQGIEANTLYAVYVQTRLVNHPGAQNAISKIHFLRTTFTVPDPPRTISAAVLDANTLKIQWDLPLNARGVISHYTFSWMIDRLQPLSNETLLCTMRSQNIRRMKDISTKDPTLASSTGTCPVELGCCKCDSSAPRVSQLQLAAAHGNDDTLLMERQREEHSQFENAIQNVVFVQNCDVSYDPLRCPDRNSQAPATEAATALEGIAASPVPDNSAMDVVTAMRKRHIIGAEAETAKHRRRHNTIMDKQRVLWQTLKSTFSRKTETDRPAKKASNTSKTTNDGAAGRRRRALPTPQADKPTMKNDDDIVALLTGNNTLATTTAKSSTHNTVEDMLLLDPYSDVVEQRLEQLRREHPESTVLYVGRFDDANATELGKVNVTTMSVVLTGLPHFSEYQINVYTCQDETAVDHFCSARPAWVSIKTSSIMEYDRVEPESVVLLNVTNGKLTDRKMYWEAPKRPNGVVLTYRVKLYRDDDSTPLEQCIPAAVFEKNKGIQFSGLPAGRYSIEIRVESSAETLGNATIIKHLFEVPSPSIFTTRNILILVGVAFLILIISTMLCFRYASLQVEEKMDKIGQNITNNPDYLSHINYYQEDSWELNREDIELKQKIGAGSFGAVFLGEGRNVLSFCGERFGKCAVKTLPEETNKQEEFLFLCEANVMKSFNTEFIVKLYGVVSNGSPVLIVMEMMEKGNLRDYLRSLRPGGPENIDNLPPPTLEDYFTWAAQIADGMAYLESKQFCHRDLAARNCMVHANRMVKIGDFGMTRDLYYQEYYRPAGKRMMPVRWMSPESLRDGTFDVRSDVWSYGIVLYEMLTLGEQPYGGMGNDDVFQMVVIRHHVPRKPIGCHSFWYSLMRACWHFDPRRRPYFDQIVGHLQQNTSSDFRRLSYVVNNVKSKRVYNFNDFGEDQGNEYRGRQADDEYSVEQFYMSSVRATDDLSNEEVTHKMQSNAPDTYAGDKLDDVHWAGNGHWSTAAAAADDSDSKPPAVHVDDNRSSLASRAIQKAREYGVPFIRRPRQNRLYNYKADKLTVFATLLGINPQKLKNRKRGVGKATGKANSSTTVRIGNDYTRQETLKKVDVCLETEKEEEKRLNDGDRNTQVEENEEFNKEDIDLDEQEDEERSEFDDGDDPANDFNDNPMQSVYTPFSFQPNVKRLTPTVASCGGQLHCDYMEADLSRSDMTTADRASKRRSASMTSSSSSLHAVPTKSNTAVHKTQK